MVDRRGGNPLPRLFSKLIDWRIGLDGLVDAGFAWTAKTVEFPALSDISTRGFWVAIENNASAPEEFVRPFANSVSLSGGTALIARL